MPDPLRWSDAALAGFSVSMRTFTAPAVLALRGRLAGRPRIALMALAAGELVSDKTRFATDRTDPPSLGGRVVVGAITGREIAGTRGLVAGGLAAAIGTFATFHARKRAVEVSGLPDPVVAVGEDVVTLVAAAAATR